MPVIGPDFDPESEDPAVEIEVGRVIVMTQSCDIENKKAKQILCCPVYTRQELIDAGSPLAEKGTLDQIRQGRREGMCLLAGGKGPQDTANLMVVDLATVYTLPVDYAKRVAEQQKPRLALRSPYTEYLGSAFGRIFSRVALPHVIPTLK